MDYTQAYRQFVKPGRSTLVPGDYFALTGGLDLETPPLQRAPGTLLGCLNYEAKLVGGYESLAGFERYDGRTRPSLAAYWMLTFTGEAGTEPAAGATVTSSSGGSAVVLAINPGASLVVGRLTGTFNSADTLTSGGWTATASAAAAENDAPDDTDNSAYQQLAIADMRAQVTQVPGSGSILGVAIYRGIVYAIRNTADGTAAAIYYATATGWVQFALGWLLKYTAGQAATIAAGDVLTGATSAATGTVRRVVVTTGSFASGTAAGYVVLYGVTGTFQSGEAVKKAGATVATANGASSANTLKPNGRYELMWKNFYGATGDIRLYGVDGVNYGFELQDGDSGWYAPVITGMPTDTPTHMAECFGSLWLSFPGGSCQRSAVNDPLSWNLLFGAAEWGVGDDVTGFLSQVATLFVYSQNMSYFWQDDGTGTGTLLFKQYDNKAGAQPFTLQNIGSGLVLGPRGFSTVATTMKFGGYVTVPISMIVDTLVKQLTGTATCSCIIQSKSIYRCFFESGDVISITINGTKVLAITHLDLEMTARCVFSDKDADDNELTVFGDDNGYIYVADSGTSFDGQTLTTFARTSFNYNKSPGRQKRYRVADIGVTSDDGAEISVAVDYSNADPTVISDSTKSIDVISGGSFWNVATWDNFRWSTGFVGKARVKLEGSGENISLLVSSSSATQGQHTLTGVTLRYSNRRLERGSEAS